MDNVLPVNLSPQAQAPVCTIRAPPPRRMYCTPATFHRLPGQGVYASMLGYGSSVVSNNQ